MTKSIPSIIAICPITGARLCRDGRWRDHAHFGTGPRCVKVYRVEGWALKAATRKRVRPAAPGETIAHLVWLYPGDTMDASGNITRNA